MIQLSPLMRVFQYIEPVDFRNGIDGLIGLCRNKLKQNPLNGSVFVFINKSKKSIKLITYDGQGFWLCQKRLSSGTFKHWTKQVLSIPQLQILLYNGNPFSSNIAPDWKPLT